MADAYDVLGVPPNCSKDDAKAAYRKLASQNHPDKGGNTATFQKIQAAWDAIEKGYKRPKEQPKKPAGGTDYTYKKPNNSANFSGAAEDWFKSTFGDPNRKAHQSHGYGSDGVLEVRMPVMSMGLPFFFAVNGNEYKLEGGLPHGWVGDAEPVKSSLDKLGNRAKIRVRIDLYASHDPAMAIRGVSEGTTLFTNVPGDCVTTINTNAINLIAGAWVDVLDAFGSTQKIRIPSGFDPARRLRIVGGGYYRYDPVMRKVMQSRGDLVLEIKPTFTTFNEIGKTDIDNALNALQALDRYDIRIYAK